MIRAAHYCLALVCALGWGQQVSWQDDFSGYAEGSDGSPVWFCESVAWEMRDGSLSFTGPMAVAYAAQYPRFERVTVETTLRVQRPVSEDWKVAAVSLYSDARNLWHLALVEAPEAQGRRHYVELAEMRYGQWLAHTNLQMTAGEGMAFDWQYRTPYRLRISLTPEGIEGEVFGPDGGRHAHLAYAFTAPAVTSGRPALRASGFEGTFDDFAFTGRDPLPEADTTTRSYPPYFGAALEVFTSEPTGFFRTEQREGRWWIVDPLGRAFFAVGTDHCRFEGHWCQKLGYAPYGRNNERRWASREDWAQQATDRLKAWGFNLIGAGGGSECRYRGLAHTEFLSLGAGFAALDDITPQVHWTGFPNVFSPKWPRYCDRRARQLCAESRNDPWLFGYFLDNELEWYGKTWGDGGLFDDAMRKPAGHTAKQALVELLKQRYLSIAALNEAWRLDLPSFEAIGERDALPATTDAARADKIAFTRLAAEEYFKHATAAIRRHDPNHMVIGCRFAGNAPAGIWDIAGKYCDIVTFNSYDRVDLEQGTAPGVAQRFADFYRQAGKPLMITEWSFPALDSGLPCKYGAGMRVDTQQQRAECFRIYQEMIFRLPFMVGSNFFMWVDEPALGISDTFPEDSNYGLVNENDEPYPELTAMAARVNATVAQLHNGDLPDLVLNEGFIAENRGKAPVTFSAVVRVDGQAREQQLTLAAGERQPLDVPTPAQPGAHLLMAELDPDRLTADSDRTDNRRVAQLWVPGVTVPEGWRGLPVTAVAVCNASDQSLPDAVAVVTRSQVPDSVWHLTGSSLVVCDLAGNEVPVQPNPDELAIAVGNLAPWDARTFLLARKGEQPLPGGPVALSISELLGRLLVVDNGRLRLEIPSPGGGNFMDTISLDGVTLGSYNPLVWQEVGGQNLWTRTSQTLATQGRSLGPVLVRLDLVAQGGDAAITAVNERGVQEQQRTAALPFEVSHRIVLYPGKPWFLARLNYIRNLADRPLTLRGYFFYLNSAIGGDVRGDRPAGPGVPNYYGWAGAAWQDDDFGLVFGALPMHEALQASFWLDEGGGQHPDARRQLDPAVTLQPDQTYTDPDQPWLLIYGGKAQDRPWQAMQRVAAALAAIRVSVHELP